MRLLHTSDWHLGRRLHGADLTDAHEAWVDHVVEVVREQRVDVVLVAGDVFDRAIPPVEALATWERALLRARRGRCRGGRVQRQPRLACPAGRPHRAAGAGRGARALRPRPRGRARGAARRARSGRALPAALPRADDHRRPAGPAVRGRRAGRGARPAQPGGRGVPGRRPGRRRGARRGPRPHGGAGPHLGGGGPPGRPLGQRARDRLLPGARRGDTGAGAGSAPWTGWARTPSRRSRTRPWGTCTGRTCCGDRLRYSGSPVAFSFSERAHRKGSWLVDLDAAGAVAVERVDAPVHRPLSQLTGHAGGPARRARRTPRPSAHHVKAVLTDAARPGRRHAPPAGPVPARGRAGVGAARAARAERPAAARVRGRRRRHRGRAGLRRPRPRDRGRPPVEQQALRRGVRRGARGRRRGAARRRRAAAGGGPAGAGRAGGGRPGPPAEEEALLRRLAGRRARRSRRSSSGLDLDAGAA